MTARHAVPHGVLVAYKRMAGLQVDQPLPRYIVVSWVTLAVILGAWTAAFWALLGQQ